MKAMLEFSGFLALALGAHLLVWNGSGSGTLEAAGQAGDGALAIAGADVALQDLVAQWDSPPTVEMTAPSLAPLPPAHAAPSILPERPRPLPMDPAVLVAPQEDRTLAVDSAPAPPPPKPKAKPPAKPKAQPKGSAAAEKPKGKGGQQVTGQNGTGQQATAASNPNQMARWGGAIRSSIERRKQYPTGSRAKGAVSLAISVSSTGALAGLAVAKSSGDAALDRAALEAVKRARLPKAPAGIPAGTHRFTLSVSFAR